MKRQHIGLLIIWLVLLSGIRITAAAAQDMSENGGIPLQIQLRYSDGTAASDEPLRLQRLPDMQEITCITDANGRCTWHVARGLYQVIFSQPLDSVSSLAVAEGGLDGFGLTVGDTPISYHFTFHHDDHVYFDAAPEAAVPAPIIPTMDSLHGGIMPTAVVLTPAASTPASIGAISPSSEEDTPMEEMKTGDTSPLDLDEIANTPTLQTNDTGVIEPVNPAWRLLFFIIFGLVLGFGLHLWSRKRQRTAAQAAAQTTEQTEVEQRLSAFILSPQPGADVSTTTQPSAQAEENAC